uniref:protein FAM83G n=1 Tax=Euleptes europaea TaxID=460621 RepID=UPI0025402438|nr:protein FAM83G [Euleptes europaea]
MAYSQVQCLDDSHVNWRSSESKPEFFYSEEQRLALEALASKGPEAFYEVLKKENIRDFLSEPELQKILETLETYDPGSEYIPRGGEHGDVGSQDGEQGPLPSLEYWPEKSDRSIPQLDLGWPESVAYRGVTRATVYMQPPIDCQPHVKEVIRKMVFQAQKVVAVVMDMFTDVDIFKDLLEAGFKRKVAIYVILDESNLKYFLQMCERAQMHAGHLKNLRVRTMGGTEFFTRSATRFKGALAQKFMFVDGDKAVTGSYSFTWSAARTDRNVISVLSGQVVEAFDKQFQELYLLSRGVSLKSIPMDEEPEPETMILPSVIPVTPANATVKKMVNPKYALVKAKSVEQVTNSTPASSDRNPTDQRRAEAKGKAILEGRVSERPSGLVEIAPPIHPGLLNLEKANMFDYLPTWVEPDPEPGSEILGYINIIDPKLKNVQLSQMNRIKVCDISQANAQHRQMLKQKKQGAKRNQGSQPAPTSPCHLDAASSSVQIQEAPNPTGHIQGAPNPTGDIQQTPNPTGQIQQTPNPTGQIQQAPNPTGHVKGAPNPTGDIQQTPNPTGHFQQAPNPTGHVKGAPNPTGDIQQTPNPTGHFQQAPNPTGHVKGAPNPTGDIQQTPNPTGHFQQAPNPKGHNQEAANTTGHNQEVTNAMSHNQEAANTTGHNQEAPNSIGHIQEAPNPSPTERTHRKPKPGDAFATLAFSEHLKQPPWTKVHEPMADNSVTPPVPKPRTIHVTDFISMKSVPVEGGGAVAEDTRLQHQETDSTETKDGESPGRAGDGGRQAAVSQKSALCPVNGVRGGEADEDEEEDFLTFSDQGSLSSSSPAHSHPHSNASSVSDEYFEVRDRFGPLRRTNSDCLPNGGGGHSPYLGLQRKLSEPHVSRGTFVSPLGSPLPSLSAGLEEAGRRRRRSDSVEEIRCVLGRGRSPRALPDGYITCPSNAPQGPQFFCYGSRVQLSAGRGKGGTPAAPRRKIPGDCRDHRDGARDKKGPTGNHQPNNSFGPGKHPQPCRLPQGNIQGMADFSRATGGTLSPFQESQRLPEEIRTPLGIPLSKLSQSKHLKNRVSQVSDPKKKPHGTASCKDQ